MAAKSWYDLTSHDVADNVYDAQARGEAIDVDTARVIASQWHSSESASGRQLLSFGSTGEVYDKAALRGAIVECIAIVSADNNRTFDLNNDMLHLCMLGLYVNDAPEVQPSHDR